MSGVYIADTGNSLIRRVFANGTIISIAGNGTASYCGDNGAASASCLSNPSSLASDGFGGILVADTGNSVVRRILQNGTIISVAGTPLISSYSGDNGPSSKATAGTIAGRLGRNRMSLPLFSVTDARPPCAYHLRIPIP